MISSFVEKLRPLGKPKEIAFFDPKNTQPISSSLWIESKTPKLQFILKEKIKNKLSLGRILRNPGSKNCGTTTSIPGGSKRLVLLNPDMKAILVWEVQEIARRRNKGIRCVLFATDDDSSTMRPEDLLLEGMLLARLYWKDLPFFVRMNPDSFLKKYENAFRNCGWKKELLISSCCATTSAKTQDVYTSGYHPTSASSEI